MLEKQVKRMLADPRSKEFVSNFAGQWLQLRNLQSAARVDELYPELRRQPAAGLPDRNRDVLRQHRARRPQRRRPADADYTFVNERLAKSLRHSRRVYGSQFRRVQLGPELDMRRGLLGKGSMLTVTVERRSHLAGAARQVGADQHPRRDSAGSAAGCAGVQGETAGEGPAPCDDARAHGAAPRQPDLRHVPQDDGPDRIRARDVRRRRRRIGPPKRASTAGSDRAASSTAPSSTVRRELRQALLRYSPRFVETLTERLMTYALGRGVKYYDMPAVRRSSRTRRPKNNRFSALVLGHRQEPGVPAESGTPSRS